MNSPTCDVLHDPWRVGTVFTARDNTNEDALCELYVIMTVAKKYGSRVECDDTRVLVFGDIFPRVLFPENVAESAITRESELESTCDVILSRGASLASFFYDIRE